MNIKKKKKFIAPGFLAISIIAATTPLLAISCTNNSESSVIGTSGYSDSMSKLANGSITLAGAWADARFYAGEFENKIVAIGATDYISNDGIQARDGLKKGDIEAIQTLFIKTVHEAEKQAKEGKESSLTYLDKKGKINSIFKIYNHDGYSKVALDSEISYNSVGDKKKAYPKTLENGNEYFEMNGDKITAKNKKAFKVAFIPSSDATLVSSATAKLQKYLNETLKLNFDISVATDYNAAAQSLASGSYDLAFLPVDTWAQHSGDSSFILQAGRDVQIIDPYASAANPSAPKFTSNDEKLLVDAINNYKNFNATNKDKELYINVDGSKNPKAIVEGYPKELKDVVDSLAKGENLPKVGYYRSYIFANVDSEIYKIVQKALKEQGSNWKLKWDDVKSEIIYGYTSTTSSASFIYPEQWFKKHFDGFESFIK
ncbi:PhnD/SsuA/transferrin family substrate-binding protein [Mycoplasma phocoeninasale]|uniref:PhnD/SsuA/transferrin family substrate-binding protein n=1 Tax=Mycoplasma phocoeninasale TaxID=2726117 RepID=A0A858TZH7_9MOLU|nr:PhnD/SsuA/transferrin family substrate-binding protein [Mycoplasma phocoeninasale]MBN0970687.1 PhnD/SsuA/transferrin family substrate-binding protein [Mycoplasma phocoeninasale]QJG66204.1 PhnD/SsuA/transferrin family substrate-binding protein [Mycoplasma phocoeninasale]